MNKVAALEKPAAMLVGGMVLAMIGYGIIIHPDNTPPFPSWVGPVVLIAGLALSVTAIWFSRHFVRQVRSRNVQ